MCIRNFVREHPLFEKIIAMFSAEGEGVGLRLGQKEISRSLQDELLALRIARPSYNSGPPDVMLGASIPTLMFCQLLGVYQDCNTPRDPSANDPYGTCTLVGRFSPGARERATPHSLAGTGGCLSKLQ